MLNAILNKIFFLPNHKAINAEYILDSEIRHDYNKNGYAIIKGIVDESSINQITEAYDLLDSCDKNKGDFITSANYGKELQLEVQEKLSGINKNLLHKIFVLDKCYSDFFSILVVKQKKENKYLAAHQDISFVDETIGNTTFVWIPIEDIDENNGAITVLPRSHLWGRWQKTHNRHISPLIKNNEWLKRKMIPLFMKRGDALIFDASLIHGSLPNKSEKDRIAMNTAVCSNHTDLIHYECAGDNNSKYVSKYFVDMDFWKNFKYTEPVKDESVYKSELSKFILNKQLSRINLQLLYKNY